MTSGGLTPIRRATDLPEDYNAIEILEWNLLERADHVALVTHARELTFREVAEEVDRVGNALRRLGVRPGDGVAIQGPQQIALTSTSDAEILLFDMGLIIRRKDADSPNRQRSIGLFTHSLGQWSSVAEPADRRNSRRETHRGKVIPHG